MKTKKIVRRLLASMLAVCSLAGMLAAGVSAEGTTENLKAIKLEINWNEGISDTQIVSYLCMKNTEGMVINSGDTLSYQVYIPSNGNYVYGMAGFNGQSGDFASSSYWFPDFQDAAGMYNFGQIDQQGTDCWITREYTFTKTASFWHLGPAVDNPGAGVAAMAGKTSIVYYRNIVIKRANGTVEPLYTDSKSLGSWDEVFGTTAGACTVSLAEGTYSFRSSGTQDVPDNEHEIPAGMDNAYQMKIEFNDSMLSIPSSGNVYNWYSFGSSHGHYSDIRLKVGDKLSYKLYIPSDSAYVPGMGTLDIQENSNWAVMSWQGGIIDQNGNAYDADLAAIYGRDHWIEIVYTLPAALTVGGGIQHIGPRNNFGAGYLEELAGKTAYLYMTDVKLIHADGTQTKIAPPDAGIYNVNDNDDLLKNFGQTVITYIGGSGSEPEVPDEPTEPEVPDEPTEPVVPEEIGSNALEVVLQFNQSYTSTAVTDNVYNWYGLGTAAGDYANIKLNSGDKLSYQIYIPADSAYVAGMGTMDIQENGGWGVMSFLGTVKDQNGNPYESDLSALYGRDHWIEIVYDLPDSFAKGAGIHHIGPRHNIGAALLDALKGKTAYYYLRNVKIIHADGTESLIAPPQTMSYNINKFDDTLTSFATTTIRSLNADDSDTPAQPEEVGSGALKFAMKFSDSYTHVPSEGNVYNWYGYGAGDGAFSYIRLKTGDKLSYKLYVPSDSAYVPGMGTIDIQENKNWSVLSFQSGVQDQNGIGYAADLAGIYGTDHWIEIEYVLPESITTGGGIQHIGIRNNFGAMNLEDLKGQTAYYYLKDVQIIHANGRVDKISPSITKLYNVNKKDDLIKPYATVISPKIVNAVVNTGSTENTIVLEGTTEPEKIVDPVVPEGMDASALEVVVQFRQNYESLPKKGDMYNWYGLGILAGNYSNVILNSGDKLSYKLYIPSDSAYVAGMGVIDLQEISKWGVLSFLGTVKDQNGNDYYADHAQLYGTDQWIEIIYELPDSITNGSGIQHIGPRHNIDATLLEELKGKTAYYYLKDIKIIHADGTESLIAPPEYLSYNVNEADDLLAYFATTRVRVVGPFQSNVIEESEPTESTPEPEVTVPQPEVTAPQQTENPHSDNYLLMYGAIVLCAVVSIGCVFVILKKRRMV